MIYYSKKTSADEVRRDFDKSIRESCEACKDLDFIVASQKIDEFAPQHIYSLKHLSLDWGFLSFYDKDYDWYLYDCRYIRTK